MNIVRNRLKIGRQKYHRYYRYRRYFKLKYRYIIDLKTDIKPSLEDTAHIARALQITSEMFYTTKTNVLCYTMRIAYKILRANYSHLSAKQQTNKR